MLTEALSFWCGTDISTGRMIAEVEQIVEIGELDPDEIHTPGIYVHRIIVNATPEKRIEQQTVTTAP